MTDPYETIDAAGTCLPHLCSTPGSYIRKEIGHQENVNCIGNRRIKQQRSNSYWFSALFMV